MLKLGQTIKFLRPFRSITLSLFFLMSAVVSTSVPKLYFRHGAVCSAKTLNLLAVAHSYKMQGKSVVILKVIHHIVNAYLLE